MKKSITLIIITIIMFLSLISLFDKKEDKGDINTLTEDGENISTPASDAAAAELQKEETGSSTDNKAYIKAYTDFLLKSDIDEDDFPIYGYYLFDMNFDKVPELGVLHHSGGSLGGYLTFYRFNGNEIVAVLDDKNVPARSSDETQILADFENKKVYFLKEMYLLQGNPNGQYGYVKEILNQNGIPCVYDILSLEVDWESDFEKHDGKSDLYEDDFLLDVKLDDCLVTQYYSNGEWKKISPEEYLRRKRELIPEENNFVDLCGTDVNIHLYSSLLELTDENGNYKKIRITAEEINTLFSKWYIE